LGNVKESFITSTIKTNNKGRVLPYLLVNKNYERFSKIFIEIGEKNEKR
jgi:hypothetical protein